MYDDFDDDFEDYESVWDDEPFDRDGWDDEYAFASAGHGMDESYIGGDTDLFGEW